MVVIEAEAAEAIVEVEATVQAADLAEVAQDQTGVEALEVVQAEAGRDRAGVEVPEVAQVEAGPAEEDLRFLLPNATNKPRAA